MYAVEVKPAINLDRTQISEHAVALGYKKGDTFYIRGFYPKEDPRSKEKGSARKAQTKSSSELVRIASQWQKDGMGVYFVVNGGGHTDKEVINCRAIFYEHDDLPKELQLKLWETLGLPEPTFQVDTGGKSIHSYWVLDQFCKPESWRELQTDLLEFADADRAIKNESRVMRLAGCFHISEAGINKSRIINNSGKRYSFEELRSIIPSCKIVQQPEFKPKIDYKYQFGDVPLSACLTKNDRDLIDSGVNEGSRNTNGAKLARNLIGTATQLRNLGIQHSEDSRQLFDLYCQRCSPAVDTKEADLIWNQAEKSNPRASLTDEAILNCINAWKYRRSLATGNGFGTPQPKSKSNKNLSNDSGDGDIPIKGLSLRDRIFEILSRNFSASELEEALIKLAESTNKTPRDIKGLVSLIRSELEIEEDRRDTQQELEKLISIKNNNLELRDYLDSSLADPLTELAYWMGISAEAYLVPLLSFASSLLSSSMRIEANQATNFYQPFIIYAGLVCETGSKKSPIIEVFLKPLNKLQQEEEKRYKEAKTTYDQELKEWKDSKEEDKGEPPIPPQVREFYVKNATHEALNEIRGTQTSGFVYVLDELSALIKTYGAYKGGRGTDKESVLSGFDGNGIKQNRAGGKRLFNPFDAMSICGATQPAILQQQMGNLEDCQGEWARFLWVLYQEKLQRLPDWGSGHVDITGTINSIFTRLLAVSNAMPEAVFTFEPIGTTLFNDYVYELDYKRMYQETRPGMKAAIAKLKGYTARLSGILYLLDCAARNEMPSTVIPAQFIELGIKLSRYFWGQVETIYAFSGASQNKLTPTLAQIIKLAEAQSDRRVTSRMVSKKLKNKREENLTNFRELEQMGYGVVELKRQGFDFILNPVSPSVPGSVPNFRDTEKPFDSNTSSTKNSPVSPVSPVSPTSGTSEFYNNEPASQSRGTILVEIRKIETLGDTGDTGTKTQSGQGFGSVPKVRDTAGDTTPKTEFNPTLYIDKECEVIFGEHTGQRGIVQAYFPENDTFLVMIEGNEILSVGTNQVTFELECPSKPSIEPEPKSNNNETPTLTPKINLNSRVRIKDARYGDEVYVVVGGNGRPTWQLERENAAQPRSNADFITMNAKQLVLISEAIEGFGVLVSSEQKTGFSIIT